MHFSLTLFLMLFYAKFERAFQKQPTVFLNRKKGVPPPQALNKGKKVKVRGVQRYTRNIGLGFKPPGREAMKFL